MNWFKKRRLRLLILLSAVSLFSITGFVLPAEGNANSFSEKVGAKLQAAVAAGKLTQEQADAKLEAIGEGKHGKKRGMRKPTAEEVGAKLQAAVAAGKLTQEQADAKLEAIGEGKHGRWPRR